MLRADRLLQLGIDSRRQFLAAVREIANATRIVPLSNAVFNSQSTF